jgi:thiamine-phosphate pyrophosphorylase
MIAYAITDPTTLDFTHLKQDLKRFASKASMIVYRDKNNSNYAQHAKVFVKNAKGFDKVLLHGDYLLANILDATGVHLKSTQFDDIVEAKKLGLFVVISTHTLSEALKAQELGADMITFSPIFDTPNKGTAIGTDVLKHVVSSVTIPVIALGGILTQEQIASCIKVGAKGFASIRYFERKLFN